MAFPSPLTAILLVFVTVNALVSGASANQCEYGANLDGAGIQIKKHIKDISEFTLEGWFKFDMVSEPDILFWLDIGNLRYKTNPNRLAIARWDSLNGGTGDLPTRTCQMKLTTRFHNEWVHIAGVSGSNPQANAKIYVNGEQLTNCGYSVDNPSGTYYADSIAAHSSSNSNPDNEEIDFSERELFHGSLAQLRVWQVKRTQQEIKDAMFNFTLGQGGSAPSDLVAAWDFRDANFNEGGKVPDITGNGYDGTFKSVTSDAVFGCDTIDLHTATEVGKLASKTASNANAIEALVATVASQGDAISQNFTSMDNRVNALQSNLSDLQEIFKKLDDLQKQIDELQKNNTDLETQLSGRMTGFETTFNDKITDLEGDIGDNKNALDSLLEKLSNAKPQRPASKLKGSSGSGINSCSGENCAEVGSLGDGTITMTGTGVTFNSKDCKEADLCDMYQHINAIEMVLDAIVGDDSD